jgi:hypothetical protein
VSPGAGPLSRGAPRCRRRRRRRPAIPGAPPAARERGPAGVALGPGRAPRARPPPSLSPSAPLCRCWCPRRCVDLQAPGAAGRRLTFGPEEVFLPPRPRAGRRRPPPRRRPRQGPPARPKRAIRRAQLVFAFPHAPHRRPPRAAAPAAAGAARRRAGKPQLPAGWRGPTVTLALQARRQGLGPAPSRAARPTLCPREDRIPPPHPDPIPTPPRPAGREGARAQRGAGPPPPPRILWCWLPPPSAAPFWSRRRLSPAPGGPRPDGCACLGAPRAARPSPAPPACPPPPRAAAHSAPPAAGPGGARPLQPRPTASAAARPARARASAAAGAESRRTAALPPRPPPAPRRPPLLRFLAPPSPFGPPPALRPPRRAAGRTGAIPLLFPQALPRPAHPQALPRPDPGSCARLCACDVLSPSARLWSLVLLGRGLVWSGAVWCPLLRPQSRQRESASERVPPCRCRGRPQPQPPQPRTIPQGPRRWGPAAWAPACAGLICALNGPHPSTALGSPTTQEVTDTQKFWGGVGPESQKAVSKAAGFQKALGFRGSGGFAAVRAAAVMQGVASQAGAGATW